MVLTFLVITGTVAVYGLTAAPVARWLGVATPNPQGVLLVGAHAWGRAIGRALRELKYDVVLVDSNWANISATRRVGLKTFHANILSEHALDEVPLEGLGRLLAVTPNDEVNSLAALHFSEIFGRSEVYQLPTGAETEGGKEVVSQHLRGRLLFHPRANYGELSRRFAAGAVLKRTKLTEEFNYEAFRARYEETSLPLFLVQENGNLVIFTSENPPTARPGQTVIHLASLAEEPAERAGPAAAPEPGASRGG